jgi:chromosomal replication initiator protein
LRTSLRQAHRRPYKPRIASVTLARPEGSREARAPARTDSPLSVSSRPEDCRFVVPEDVPNPTVDEISRVWDEVRRTLRDSVTDYTFHIWLEPLRPAAQRGGTLFVRAPDHIRSWVGDRYLPLIRSAAARASGGRLSVEVVDEEWQPQPQEEPASRRFAGGRGDDGLNPKYTFEQFVICDGNRLPHGAALTVAEMPAQAYNPLFVYGRPGLGKTHLLHAIGNYIKAFGGGLSVRYATVEEFTSAFVGAVRRGGDAAAFRGRFRDADVLLIDDVQFLADKVRTEEEFFHTFNSLYESGRQLVLTSDRPPRDIEALEARLRERFESGLLAELEPPDFEARVSILRKRARLDSLGEVGDATLAAIAEHVDRSVRALEGALIRVIAYASLRGTEATPELARRVLERLYPRAESVECTVEQIQLATARAFGLAASDLLAHDRRPHVALARQVAMYLARELTPDTLPGIGRSFGGRNHSTVLHAHRRISDQLKRDADTFATVEKLRTELSQAS